MAASSVAACTTVRSTPGPDGPVSTGPSPTPDGSPPARAADPDVALARRVLRSERAMVRRLDAAVLAQPALREVLAEPRAIHRRHVTLLVEAVPGATDMPPSDPDGGGQSGQGAPSRRRRAAMQSLSRAESTQAETLGRGAFAARSGAFARVLGSMAASSAQQASVLGTSAQDAA